MVTKIKGVIISVIPYKNTSKIFNVFTSEGIIGVLVKNKDANDIDKLTYGIFSINKRKGLSILNKFKIIDDFKNIKDELIKMSYTNYITNLVIQTYRHEENINIYNLYIDSLNKINQGLDVKDITNILELKLLEYLAIMPIIDCCVECGNINDIVTISSYKGGCICKKCLKDEKIVNDKTIKLIRMFYYVDIKSITKLDISDTIKKEINNFLWEHYDRYSGIYLKKKENLNS